MTEEQAKMPRQYKKKKREIVFSNTEEEIRQVLVEFMSEFMCNEILSGRLVLSDTKNIKE